MIFFYSVGIIYKKRYNEIGDENEIKTIIK